MATNIFKVWVHANQFPSHTNGICPIHCFKLRARRDQLQIPIPNYAKAKAFSQEQQAAQWTTVFLISFHQARQSTHWWSGVEAALLSSADCRIVDIFLFCTLTELLVLTKFWTFLNMVHLHFVFTFSESLCYVLLFSWPNKNFLFWQLSNRVSCFGPPNRKKPYNKHLILQSTWIMDCWGHLWAWSCFDFERMMEA